MKYSVNYSRAIPAALLLFAFQARAGYSYEGVLTDASGYPVTTSHFVKFQILSPIAGCLLYEEVQPAVIPAADGYFNVTIGSGTRSDAGSHTLNQVFETGNTLTSLTGCSSGTTYTGALNDPRKINVLVSADGSTYESLGTMTVNPVPMASTAEKVGSFGQSSLLRVSTAGVPGVAAPLTGADFTELQALLSGTSTKYSKVTSTAGASLPSYTTAAPPTTPVAGSMWYDSTSNSVRYYNGSATQTFGTSGAGISSLTVGASLSAGGIAGGTLSASGTIDLVNSGVTAGSYPKVTVDGKGRVTAGSVLTSSDIPTLSTPGQVSGAALSSGTIGGSTAMNTTGSIATTGTLTANSGIFTTGKIGIGTTAPVSALQVAGSVQVGVDVTACAAAVGGSIRYNAGTLQFCDGSSWNTLGLSGAGMQSFNGSSQSAQTLSTPGVVGTAPNWSSTSGIHTLNIPMASNISVTAGLISKTDYDAFNTKLGAVTNSALLTSGKIWVGDAANKAQEQILAGDVTMSNTGTVNLNTVQVGKGGTGTTTLGGNKVLTTNGTGTQVLATSCSLNQVLSFDASGNYVCSYVASLFPGFINGGSTFGTAATLGTNDSFDLSLKTNNINRLIIMSNGNVGIGVTLPAYPLDVTGDVNTAGVFRMQGLPVLSLSSANSNFAVGASTMNAGSVTGVNNTALGQSAMSSATGAGGNTGLGAYSLRFLTTGASNTAVGVSALGNITTAGGNTAVGQNSLVMNTFGGFNAALGQASLNSLTGAGSDFNVAVGTNALYFLTGGTQNVAIGYNTGATLTSGSNNILIGNAVNVPAAATSSYMNIGNLIYGNMASGRVGIGINAPKTNLDVAGHIAISGPALAGVNLSAGCGTSGALIDGNDMRGEVTYGLSGTVACAITFSSAFTTRPYCVVTSTTSTTSAFITSTTSTSLTIGFNTAPVSGYKFTYMCMQ